MGISFDNTTVFVAQTMTYKQAAEHNRIMQQQPVDVFGGRRVIYREIGTGTQIYFTGVTKK